MNKVGLVVLGFLLLTMNGCERLVEKAEREGEDWLTAYRALRQSRQEAKK